MSICQREERAAGRPYPRTCPTCKLGPCSRSTMATDPKYAEIARLNQQWEDHDAAWSERVAVLTVALHKTEAERDAALAQVAAFREIVAFHEHLAVDPSALSRRDAQMRAEGRKEGLREAAALCDDTAQEALEESGAESRAIWTWFRGQRDAILAAAEREASP